VERHQEYETEAAGKLLTTGVNVPPLMITRPIHEIIEWKRTVVEEDSFPSTIEWENGLNNKRS